MEYNINDVIDKLINTNVMKLILEDDFKTLNNLKRYLKKNSKNVTRKKLSEDNLNLIFNKSFQRSLKYIDKGEQLLFFSKDIFEKMNDEDFNVYVYRYLTNFE